MFYIRSYLRKSVIDSPNPDILLANRQVDNEFSTSSNPAIFSRKLDKRRPKSLESAYTEEPHYKFRHVQAEGILRQCRKFLRKPHKDGREGDLRISRSNRPRCWELLKLESRHRLVPSSDTYLVSWKRGIPLCNIWRWSHGRWKGPSVPNDTISSI